MSGAETPRAERLALLAAELEAAQIAATTAETVLLAATAAFNAARLADGRARRILLSCREALADFAAAETPADITRLIALTRAREIK